MDADDISDILKCINVDMTFTGIKTLRMRYRIGLFLIRCGFRAIGVTGTVGVEKHNVEKVQSGADVDDR